MMKSVWMMKTVWMRRMRTANRRKMRKTRMMEEGAMKRLRPTAGLHPQVSFLSSLHADTILLHNLVLLYVSLALSSLALFVTLAQKGTLHGKE
jgi:hypothetical protein